MSYCRFLEGDVYVVLGVLDGKDQLICEGCVLQESEFVTDDSSPLQFYLQPVGEIIQTFFDNTAGMVEHLRRHEAAGHDVPDDVIPELWADDHENFGGDGQSQCPVDGASLLRVIKRLDQPTLFEHLDGTSHEDRSAELRVQHAKETE